VGCAINEHDPVLDKADGTGSTSAGSAGSKGTGGSPGRDGGPDGPSSGGAAGSNATAGSGGTAGATGGMSGSAGNGGSSGGAAGGAGSSGGAGSGGSGGGSAAGGASGSGGAGGRGGSGGATGGSAGAGEAGVPGLSINPGSHDFLAVDTGSRPTRVFTITNPGAQATPPLDMPTVTGDAAYTITGQNCSGTSLAPTTGSCSITVQFAPVAYGKKDTTLRVSAGALSATSPVTGTGRQTFRLTVSPSIPGGAAGTITGSNGDINCGATCTHDYVVTTTPPTVTLSSAPGACSTFSGWSGVAGCTDAGAPCQVLMDGPKTVTATFGLQSATVTVTKSEVDGASGTLSTTLSGNVQNCAPTCTLSTTCGATITIAATPGSKTGFYWTQTAGTCAGGLSPCSVSAPAGSSSLTGTFSPYNYAFVSSSVSTSSLGGLAGANSKCQNLATAASLPGAAMYVAFLSTNSVDAITQLGNTARGWLRPDGQPFVDRATDITQGKIYYPLTITEQNNTAGAPIEVFTGSTSGASRIANSTCNGWTSGSSAFNVAGGNLQGSASNWLTWSTGTCDQIPSGHIYCFGTKYANVVTVPPVTSQKRRVFRSATPFAPGPGKTIADADAACKADAVDAGVCSSVASCPFKAVLATNGASAKSHFANQDSMTPVVRLDNVYVALSSINFWLGILTAPIGPDSAGAAPQQGERLYTGATAANAAGNAASTCGNWADGNATSGAIYGILTIGTDWFNWTNLFGCRSSLRVYCLEDTP
jgi:hypothetical protein